MSWLKENQSTLGLGAFASVVATFLTNEALPVIAKQLGYADVSSLPLNGKAFVYLAASFAFLLPLYLAGALPTLLQWLLGALALWSVTFLAHGFRTWAAGKTRLNHAKDLWSWISDQVLVAQGRHAFSVECIAFANGGGDGQTKVVLIHRAFPGFAKHVYLWPGGRIRGVEDDLGEEAKKIFKRETGCTVRLVTRTTHDGEKVKSIDGQGKEIVNWYSPAPFLVMHQNRPQKHGVPGHTALLYVGTLDDIDEKLEEVRLVEVSRLARRDEFPARELWPDTAQSINLAHEYWKSSHGSS